MDGREQGRVFWVLVMFCFLIWVPVIPIYLIVNIYQAVHMMCVLFHSLLCFNRKLKKNPAPVCLLDDIRAFALS